MAEPTSSFDLDAVRAAHIESLGEIPFRTLRMYDRDWRVFYEPNLLAGLEMVSGDGNMGQFDFLLGWIHPDERADFRKALYSDVYFDAELLGKLTDFLMVEVAARPTVPPVPSAGGSPTTSEPSKDDSSSEVPVA